LQGLDRRRISQAIDLCLPEVALEGPHDSLSGNIERTAWFDAVAIVRQVGTQRGNLGSRIT
jgi:hypothetical protein